MPWKRNILVVANVTATSPELLDELKSRAAREESSFTLIVPATPVGGGREAAFKQLEQALSGLQEAGLDARGEVGAADPLVAVTDAWDPRRYDEIVVSTLPMRFSKWLHAGLPERIAKLTGASVAHVVAEPHAKVAAVPAPVHKKEPMGPLTVLGWGGPKEES
jgi:hypothetical protein